MVQPFKIILGFEMRVTTPPDANSKYISKL